MRKRIDVKLLLASLGVAVGIVFVVAGVNASVTGREQQQLPDEIESIDPISGATQVPNQTRVFVDLIDGYRAELTVDGIVLETIDLGEIGDADSDVSLPQPGEQISLPPGAVFEPGNATLTFVPSEGGLIEEFAQGQHTATVEYWSVDDGRERARRFSWSFYVV